VIDLVSELRAGDHLEAGQEVFWVVPPGGGDVLAQVAMEPQMAAVVSEGSKISCRLPDMPGTVKGSAECWVDHVSAAPRNSEDGFVYYLVQLRIETISTTGGPDGTAAALPGVPVSVTVITREVSALRWLGERIGLVDGP
jgi:hypothetical protein